MKQAFLIFARLCCFLGTIILFVLFSCDWTSGYIIRSLQPALPVAEDTPAFLSVGQLEFSLQLLPEQDTVLVTSSFHPLADTRLRGEIPTGSFVLKKDAYGVESRLRALMKEGYTRWEAEHGEEEISGEAPYISYLIGDKNIYCSILRYGLDFDSHTPLHELNDACFEANMKELAAPAARD